MGQRQKILRSAVAAGIVELRAEAGRVLHIRRRDLAEQMIELRGLRGKNTSVIKHMRSRIEQEQTEFNTSGAKIQAVRSIHLKLLREVFNLLGTPTLKSELAELTKMLKQPGIKLGVQEGVWRDVRPPAREPGKGPKNQRGDPEHAGRVVQAAQFGIWFFAAGAQASPRWRAS